MSEKITIDFSDVLSNLENENEHDTLISRHELECFVAGDLVKERRGEIQEMLAADAALQKRVDILVAENQAFQKRMPLSRFEKDFESRLHSPKSNTEKGSQRGENSFIQRFMDWMSSPFAVGGTALMGAAALFFIVVSPGQEGGLRGKGGGQISFYVQSEKGARLGVDGENLQEGERLQFALHDDPRARSMVVVGIDGKGQVSMIASESFTGKSNTTKGSVAPKRRLLAESLVLDDAIGAERFFVIYAEGSLAKLEKAAKAAAEKVAASHLDLQKIERLDVKALSQSSVHIVKTIGAVGGQTEDVNAKGVAKSVKNKGSSAETLSAP